MPPCLSASFAAGFEGGNPGVHVGEDGGDGGLFVQRSQIEPNRLYIGKRNSLYRTAAAQVVDGRGVKLKPIVEELVVYALDEFTGPARTVERCVWKNRFVSGKPRSCSGQFVWIGLFAYHKQP